MISKSNVSKQRSKNMASRFASSTQQEIEKLLEDKDSENTKRSTKVAKELFYEYLKEKNIQEPHDKNELAQVLKSFYVDNAIMRLSLFSLKRCIIKQLLVSVFVISGIIKVSFSVVSTSTLIILDITKTSSNNCLLLYRHQCFTGKYTTFKIDHFTVVCLVAWPSIESQAGGDLVFIQTSLLFICNCKLVSIRTA